MSPDHLSGPGTEIDLTRIDGAELVQMRRGRRRLLRFTLHTPTRQIRQTVVLSPRAGGPEEDQQQFLAMLSALAVRLSELRPTLTYQMEETGRRRLVLFLIGLGVLTIGLALTGAAFLSLLDRIVLLLAALPFLAATKVCGAVLIWKFWPFRQPDALPIASLPYILWTMGGPRPLGLPADQTRPTGP
ncbi:hypothetical protein [Pseudooceanicola sp. HF7]|uniref:hypothetical protein n=1 Tax=Pseudooceanicola sp. HF7 TaxID=2721560 RepID=UPI0014305CB7|nr:hypothetical protein [Pseudooceanicola sp. HF7]NIZ10983.1 hypothetical protein [Pseudooceanicola sp. HF7]